MEEKSLSELFNLSRKTAIVTGGAMGIGFGIARRLAEAGANIVIVDLDEKTGNASVEELKKSGWEAVFIKTNVSKEKDIENAISFALKTYGTIDILINNAGIYPQIPVIDMKLEVFERTLAVNLKSAFLFTQAVGKLMIKQGRGGKIINITSIDALHPSGVGLAAYDASKHGLLGLTKSTALELAPYNIQVNAIAPGSIDTPGSNLMPATPERQAMRKKFLQRIPMKHMGKPDDIGKVALFLASDLSGYMTGSQIVVDGGFLLS